MLTRKLALPYSTGLVAAGIGLGFVPTVSNLPLSRDLIFTVFLPPLIFEAALQIEWPEFRRELPLTLLLAFFGVAVAAGVVAVGVHLVLGWSWIGAGLFGVLIAATDPVSVIAAFKEMKVERRLSLLVDPKACSTTVLRRSASGYSWPWRMAVRDRPPPLPDRSAGRSRVASRQEPPLPHWCS